MALAIVTIILKRKSINKKTMEYILINRVGDAKIIADYKTSFETYTLKELVKAYNKEAKSGIAGVHRQALYLAALRQEFKERLKESPGIY